MALKAAGLWNTPTLTSKKTPAAAESEAPSAEAARGAAVGGAPAPDLAPADAKRRRRWKGPATVDQSPQQEPQQEPMAPAPRSGRQKKPAVCPRVAAAPAAAAMPTPHEPVPAVGPASPADERELPTFGMEPSDEETMLMMERELMSDVEGIPGQLEAFEFLFALA